MANEDEITKQLKERVQSHRKLVSSQMLDRGDCLVAVHINKAALPAQAWFLEFNERGVAKATRRDFADVAEIATLSASAIAEKYLGDEHCQSISLGAGLRHLGVVKCEDNAASLSVRSFMDLFGLPRGMSEVEVANFTQLLDKAEKERLETGVTAGLKARLNESALDIVSVTQDFTFADYAFYAADGERGERRRQAGSIYKPLACLFSRRPSLKLSIDTARPLNEALAQAFEPKDDGSPRVTKGLLKRLRNVEATLNHVTPEELLVALSEVPVDWIPKTDKDWEAFCVLTASVGRTLRETLGTSMDVLYSGCGGKWDDYLQSLARAYTDTRPPEGLTEEEMAAWEKSDKPAPDTSLDAIRAACLHAEDMAFAFANQVVLPLAANEVKLERYNAMSYVQVSEAVSSAVKTLFEKKSAVAIFESARHWHSQRDHVAAELIEADAQRRREQAAQFNQYEVPDDGWAPVIQPVVAPNRVTIMPLVSPEELREEGQGLSHCVGSYAGACRNGNSHILSFRYYQNDAEFDRLSTIEVSGVDRETGRLEVRQHRGRANGAPPAEATQAFNWLQTQIAENLIPINWDRIGRDNGRTKARVDDVHGRCGYDWKSRELIMEAMNNWGRYVSKRHRKMGLQEFAASPEVVSVAESMVPGYQSMQSIMEEMAAKMR